MDFEEIVGLVNQAALEQIGRPLKDVERLVLQGAWHNQTYGAMADQAVGYSEDYLKKDVGPKLWHLLSDLVDPNRQGIKVTKRNLQNVLRTWAKQGMPPRELAVGLATAGLDTAGLGPSGLGATGLSASRSGSTVEATDTLFKAAPGAYRRGVRSAPAVEVTDFWGRAEALTTLTQWITGAGLEDGPCRLVLLWGLPGVGKTALAGQIIHRLGPQMDRCGYVDLADYPDDEALLSALADWLTPGERPPLESTNIDPILDGLGQQRCLLVVDGLETRFAPQQLAGRYQPGTETLQHLLQRWATQSHASCVVVISREPPADRFQWLGPRARGYGLSDLSAAETQTLLQQRGVSLITPDQGQQFWQRYGGNPLLLRRLATTLHTVYQGQIAPFLTQPPQAEFLGHPWLALLQRLTAEEAALLFWLTLARIPASLAQLQTAMPSYPGPAVVQSLVDRGLCQVQALLTSPPGAAPLWPPATSPPSVQPAEKEATPSVPASTDTQIGLPPLVQRLVEPHLLDLLATELLAGEFLWLQRLPLVMMTAPESVQTEQRAALIEPLAQRLRQHVPTNLAQTCYQRLQTLRQQHRGQPGFGAANWLQLCQALGVSVSGVDFSELALWQADLRQVCVQGANLSQVQFRQTAFATALGRSPRVAFCPVENLSHRHLDPMQADDPLMITGDQEGRLLLWSVGWGQLVQTLDDGVALAIEALALSSDGDTLAIGNGTGQIWLWPLGSRIRSDALPGHGAAVRALAFSGDGTWLASGDERGELRLWEVASGRCWACWTQHQGSIHSLAFSTAGDRLISSGDDQTTCLWDLSQGKLITAFQAPAPASVRTAGFLPDPNNPDRPALPFAAGYDDHGLVLWDVQTGRPCWLLATDVCPLPALALSPDGQYLACSRPDFSVVVWDIPSRALCYRLPPADAPVWWISFSPDGRYLVTGSDYQIHLWQAATGAEFRRFLGQAHPVTHLAISIEANQVLTGHNDHQLRLWPLPTHPYSPTTLADLSDPLQAVALSPDGRWCASAGQAIHLWDSATGQRPWIAHYPAQCLAFSPDGQWLASAEHSALHLWSVKSGQRVRQWPNVDAPPSALIWGNVSGEDSAPSTHTRLTNPHVDSAKLDSASLNQVSLISGHRDGTITLWPLRDGQEPRHLNGHQRPVHSLAVSPDGTTLISSSHDGTVCWWDLAQGCSLGDWTPPDGHWIHSVAFDPSGTALAATSHGMEVVLWHPQTHQRRHILRGHRQPIWAAIFSPDGTRLATASHNSDILIWEVDLGRKSHQLQPDRPYAGVNLQGATGLSAAELAVLKSLGALVNGPSTPPF